MISEELLKYYGIAPELLADPAESFSVQGELTKQLPRNSGLRPAFLYHTGQVTSQTMLLSLNVLQPGEVATTAGTSGVIYGVTDKTQFDPLSRINTFLHVNHTKNMNQAGSAALHQRHGHT